MSPLAGAVLNGAERRLGSTGINPSAMFGGGPSKAQCGRGDRHELRALVRRYADRTLIPVYRDSTDPMTGEIVSVVVREVPRDDKYLACGRRRKFGSETVDIVMAEGEAGTSGLQSCGSGWVCPVCSAAIQAHRAKELGQVLTWARAEGHTLAMITLTVRHSRSQPLVDVWDAVSDGWSAVTTGAAWVSEKVEKFRDREDRWDEARHAALEGRGKFPRGGRDNVRPQRHVGDQERYGVLGWARAVEVTDGLNGWHVHVHAIVVLEGARDVAKANATALGDAMFDRWERGLAKTGFTARKNLGGLHVSVTEAAEARLVEYLTKDQGSSEEARGKIIASHGKKARKLAMEAALGDAKLGKRGGRTPFQILAEIDPSNPGRDLARWREWVEGSAGRLALTWSKGLRELAALPPEGMTDEEIAAEPLEGAVAVASFSDAGWVMIRDEITDLLTLLENRGPEALYAWLRREGVPFDTPDFG